MAKKKKQTVGYKYFASGHFVLCHGPIDAITKISMNDKDAYFNEESENKTIYIDKPSLFGGDDQQGGVQGNIELLFGHSDQVKSAVLQNICSNISDSFKGLISAYRGVCSVVFNNIYIGTAPNLPDSKWRVKRIHTRHDGELQWYDLKAEINGVYYKQNGEVSGDPIADFIKNNPDSPFVKPVLDSILGGTNYSINSSNNTITKHPSLDDLPYNDPRVEYYYWRQGYPLISPKPTTSSYCSAYGAQLVAAGLSHSVTGIKQNSPASFSCTLSNATVFTFARYNNSNYDSTIEMPKGVDYKISDISKQIANQAKNGDSASQMLEDVSMQGFSSSDSDINPAHIIRECLTNKIWGIGVAESNIDDVAFKKVADVLFNENMGMSIKWIDSTTINEFIGNVLEHVNAQLYLDRITNKWKLYLIRNDYNKAELVDLNENNIRALEFERRTLAECINAVTITYWDRPRAKDSTVTVQDIARIAQQGGVVSQAIEYTGFTNPELASRVALRELKTLSSTLANVSFEVDESLSESWHNGMPFILSDANYGLFEAIMRITSIKRGNGIDNTVYVEAIEDSFSSPMQSVIEYLPPQNATRDNALNAEAIAFEVPYIELVEQYGQDEVDAKLLNYSDLGYVGMGAIRPNNKHVNANLFSSSGDDYDEKTTLDFCPSASLKSVIGYTDSSFELSNVAEFSLLQTNNRIQINDEIMNFVGFDASTNIITVKRGCFDTVPQEHDAGSFLFGWDNFSGIDPTEYLDGEVVSLKALTITGADQLALSEATAHTVNMSARAIRPYPPANVKINDQYYPEEIETNLILNWVDRNRLQETGGTPLGFFGDGIGIEPNTETYLVLSQFDENQAELETLNINVTGLASYILPISSMQVATSAIKIKLKTVRDGYESYQSFEHIVSIKNV